jgi:hypothetical protein
MKTTTYKDIYFRDVPSDLVDPRDVDPNRKYTGELLGPFDITVVHHPIWDVEAKTSGVESFKFDIINFNNDNRSN